MQKLRLFAKSAATLLAFAVALLAASGAQAEPDIRIFGNSYYSHTQRAAFIAVDEIANLSVAQGISSNVRLELWAFPFPFTGLNQVGYGQIGHLMATYDLGPLTQDFYFEGVYTGPIPFTPPPPGRWYVTLLVTDYNGGYNTPYGYLATDFVNFPAENFAQPVATAQAAQIIPQTGLWWNPNEPGTGYGIDYKHGTLVVTVFTYKANGEPQWYLAAGPMDGNSFSATLDRYTAGQCISCAYMGGPTLGGNDGRMTINFTSSTSATVGLPGGRSAKIEPQAF